MILASLQAVLHFKQNPPILWMRKKTGTGYNN